MKACPACGRLYPDDAGFCPVDGAQLTSATQVPVLADNQDARIGQLLCNRYQVRRVVADGGMGRVYEALDMQARRNVALKVLHPDVSRDQIAVERFKREFEVSKMLPHDYIVEVLDFQPTPDESFVLAMEFLYGEELRATLKREQVISPARMLRMLSQVAIGLDEAHARKFVHRDLKPDNLFLCQTHEGDIAKLLDFGSAKDKGESAKKLTVLGTTIGSPFYMAPEQAQGLETLDHRADVWALAAIIYECVVGRVPFIGNNGPSILLQILTKEPAPPSEAAQGPEVSGAAHARSRDDARVQEDRGASHRFGGRAGRRGRRCLRPDRHSPGVGQDHRGRAERPRATRPCPGCSATVAAPRAANVADSFFGESDSLDAMGDPAVAQAQRPVAGDPRLRGAPAYASDLPARSEEFGHSPSQACRRARTRCCWSRLAGARCSSASRS